MTERATQAVVQRASAAAGTRYFVAIDDTDNLDSRGTGARARQLCRELLDEGLVHAVDGITRHQLLVSPEIPYTSHNSSACLSLDLAGAVEDLIEHCRAFLLRESADGSDAGLCVAPAEVIDAEIRRFGQRAKTEVLTQAEARVLAADRGLHLEGLTGTQGGVIGALAAAGLRAAGEDGRFLWVRGLREITGTRQRAGDLLAATGVDTLRRYGGQDIDDMDAEIDLGVWARPVLLGGRAVLLVEEAKDEVSDWRVVPKAVIKRY